MDNQTERRARAGFPIPGNGRSNPSPVVPQTPPTHEPATTRERGGIAAPPPIPDGAKPSAQDLSTIELVKEIAAEVGHLVQKQIELARTELKADLKAEATMMGGLGIAAFGAAAAVNLLLVTVVLVLAQAMPGWQAGLLVSGAVILIAAIVAVVAWKRRVRSPLARTQRTLREDVEWTRERLA